MRSSRRDFVGAIGTGAAALTLGARGALAAPAAAAAARAKDDGPVLLIGDDIAVVSTEHGKVRGYTLRGIHHFLGIPYGADTSGANRFLPPQKPKPWTTCCRRSGGATQPRRTWRTATPTRTARSAITGTTTT